MKALIITLFIWIFVVPAATALLLIFGFAGSDRAWLLFPLLLSCPYVLQLFVHFRAVLVFPVSL